MGSEQSELERHVVAQPIIDQNAQFNGNVCSGFSQSSGAAQLFYRNNIYTIQTLHIHVTSLAMNRWLNPSGAIA
ncbi:MAG: hypothetical protein ABJH07_11785 [Sedimentitalea sp.]|uniref:hypothetical protein n=1 Tax=Sedimentitalea sp. TaxID=2048915 RepID=UPI0032980E26